MARIAKWIAIAVGGLVLLVGALLLGLNTGPGRNLLAGQLAGFETESGLRFSVERIDGSIYGQARLVNLRISDPKGAFLTARQVDLDWRPFAYLHGRIDVRSLSAPEMRLLRLPETKAVPADPNAPILPDIDLALGRLQVDRFIVEPPVTGKRHVIRLAGNADIADGRARLAADARALVEAGVAGGDRAVIRLDAVPDENRLLIDARLSAPAGGLVDSFTGLAKPLSLAVTGRGDWTKWDGRGTATLAGAPLADLAVTGRSGTFRARGRTMPGLLMEGPVERLTAPALAIDLNAVLAERRADLRFAARSPALAVDGSGRVDLAQSRLGNFTVAARLLKPGSIADNLSGRDVRLSAVLDGPFATPTIAYRLNAAALAFGTTGVEGLRAEGRATIDADRILIPVNAYAGRVTGLNAAAGGLLERLSINGDLAWSGGRLLSDNLRLRSSQIDATAIIVADMAKGRYTGAIKGRVNDYRIAGLGRIRLVTDAELVSGPSGGFGIKGVARFTTRRIENAALAGLLGGNAVTTLRFGFDEKGTASLTALRVNAPGFRVVDGQGSFNIDNGRIAFRANAVSRDYGPLAVLASGTLERPDVRLRAARPGLGVGLRDVEARLRGLPEGYAIVATGQSAYGPLSADFRLRTGRQLMVDIRRATFAGVDFAGSLTQTAAGPFAGTLTMAGSGLNGSVRLAAAGANQQVHVDATANAARIPGDMPITIGSGLVRMDATLYPEGPSAKGAFRFADIRQGDMIVNRAQGRFDYRGGSGSVALTADGRAQAPFSIAAQAALSPSRVVANARGRMNGIDFRLAQPAVAIRQGQIWRLQPTTLVVPQGRLTLDGSYGAETALQARLDNMDVAIVQAFMPGLGLGGRATGTIDYRASAAVPTVRARIDVDRFTRTSAYVVSEPVNIALLATLDDGGGDMRALVRRGGAILGRVQARLAPLGGGETLSQRIFAAPLSGGIRYNGPADVLWTLTGISGQTVSGPIALAADFGGRVDRPTVNGLIRAKTLRYENEAYGTVISRIAIEGRFTQSRLDVLSLNGRAGEGTVEARGSIGLDAQSGFPISLSATLRRAQLARGDALGATASGTLAITNGPNGGLIKGDLTVPEARYQIIRQGAAEIAELEGVRRRTDRPDLDRKPAPSAFATNWRLDIRVRADNRIFVSGMGLEAEWATDLHVGGTANAPLVTGTLDVVRGTYSFAGRRFDLDEDGEIRFTGPMTDPQLDLLASTTVENVSATINIGGRAQNPQISFSSTPALPQDEVLSRLLFGTSVTSLSPMQAIQLAAALNSLRGSGGGLNPLGKLRSATGIDRLRILGADEASGRGTALAAGQYISNDIYVEIITDARGFTATQLEIALSKALSLLSQTGSFGGSNVGIRYSKDY